MAPGGNAMAKIFMPNIIKIKQRQSEAQRARRSGCATYDEPPDYGEWDHSLPLWQRQVTIARYMGVLGEEFRILGVILQTMQDLKEFHITGFVALNLRDIHGMIFMALNLVHHLIDNRSGGEVASIIKMMSHDITIEEDGLHSLQTLGTTDSRLYL
ncbi:hypothetical protein MMC14_005248 [Varicellaria rhodocarpa]|nr:hypothetical protein [Varicellaria rhodocarpa]